MTKTILQFWVKWTSVRFWVLYNWQVLCSLFLILVPQMPTSGHKTQSTNQTQWLMYLYNILANQSINKSTNQQINQHSDWCIYIIFLAKPLCSVHFPTPPKPAGLDPPKKFPWKRGAPQRSNQRVWLIWPRLDKGKGCKKTNFIKVRSH
jgi:hypothetical protein